MLFPNLRISRMVYRIGVILVAGADFPPTVPYADTQKAGLNRVKKAK